MSAPQSGLERIWRAAEAWLLDLDVDTHEKIIVSYTGILAGVIMVLSSRVIVEPPPWFRGFALILPAWMWCALFITALILQLRGRRRLSWCTRRNGAICGLVVSGMLAPSLWPMAPGLGTGVVAALVFQAVLAGRLAHICKQQRGQGQ